MLSPAIQLAVAIIAGVYATANVSLLVCIFLRMGRLTGAYEGLQRRLQLLEDRA